MSNKHPPPIFSFSSGTLDIIFRRLWTCEKWWVSLRAHCCACFPTCGLLFLSKPRASSGAHLHLCYLLRSPTLAGKWAAKIGFLLLSLVNGLCREPSRSWMQVPGTGWGVWVGQIFSSGWSELALGLSSWRNHSLCDFTSSTCTEDWRTVSKLNNLLLIPTLKSIVEQTLWEDTIDRNKNMNLKSSVSMLSLQYI